MARTAEGSGVSATTEVDRVRRMLTLYAESEARHAQADEILETLTHPQKGPTFAYATLVALDLPYTVYPPDDDVWWLSVSLSKEQGASVDLPPEGLEMTAEGLRAAFPYPGFDQWVEQMIEDGYLVREGEGFRALNP